jgi:hypothetical protein
LKLFMSQTLKFLMRNILLFFFFVCVHDFCIVFVHVDKNLISIATLLRRETELAIRCLSMQTDLMQKNKNTQPKEKQSNMFLIKTTMSNVWKVSMNLVKLVGIVWGENGVPIIIEWLMTSSSCLRPVTGIKKIWTHHTI